MFSGSDSEDGGVGQIRIDDRGGQQQYVDVLIESAQAKGVIDSGAEITIINVIWSEGCTELDSHGIAPALLIYSYITIQRI